MHLNKSCMMFQLVFSFVLLNVGYNKGGHASNDTSFRIGAVCSHTNKFTEQSIYVKFMTYTITCYHTDVSDVYDVYRTVHVLDNTTVDVIVILEPSFVVMLNEKNLANATSKPLVFWGNRNTGAANMKVRIHDGGQYAGHTPCDLDTEPDTQPLTKECRPPVDNLTHSPLRALVGKTLLNGPVLMASLMKHLHWKYVIIVYENATALELEALTQEMSEHNILFAIYGIEDIGKLSLQLKSSYKSLNGFTLQVEDTVNFLVLCRESCAARVMQEANDFDSYHNANKTVLRNLSKWMIALYGQADYGKLKQCCFDLDNVLLVPIPELMFEQAHSFIPTMRKVSVEVTYNYTDENKQIPTDWKSTFLLKIETESELASTVSRCESYKIETLRWVPTGRQFTTVGYINYPVDVVIKTPFFPNANNGYNKREFHVSVIEFPPFIVRKENSSEFTGYCIDILKELSHVLNFTYRLTEVPDGNYGVLVNKTTMEFNGLIGQVQRSEVDLVVGDIAITRDREQVIDFTYPFYYGYTTVIVKRPDEDQFKWRKLVDPLKWQVVALIAVTLLVASLIVYLLERSNPFYFQDAAPPSLHKHNCRQLGCGVQTYGGAISCLYASLFNEANLHMPRSTTGRTFLSCWSMFCMVIAATYCGNLIAFLTVTKLKMPFDSLKEMAAFADTYTWGTIGGTLWEANFMSSETEAFQDVGDAMRRFNESDPTVLHKRAKFHLDRVRSDDNYAFIGDDASVDIALASNCDLTKIKERFIPLTNAFGFPDKSPHTRIFAKQLMAMHESGLIEIWKRKWWPAAQICSGDTKTEAKPIALMDVQSAFYIALIGIFLSSVAFIIEIIIPRIRREKLDKGNNS